MRRKIGWMGVILFLGLGVKAFAETIVTHETDKYFFKDGQMERFDGQVENTYFLDEANNTLVRTRIYDFQTKKITPDETVYSIQNQLHSHPLNAANFSLAPVIRAFTQSGPDAVEMIQIENEFVTTSLSTANEFVVSRAKRLK